MKNETPTERTCPKCGCVYTCLLYTSDAADEL